MTTTDTDPDGEALFGGEPDSGLGDSADSDAHARRNAADALLQKFSKARPPAPTPKQRAESNGDPFVAYSAVHSPAMSSRPHITMPGVRVDSALTDSIDNETTELPPVAENTVILPERRKRRALVLVAVGALLLGSIALLLSAALRSPGPKVVSTTPTVQTIAPPAVPRSNLDIPPPPPLTEPLPTASAKASPLSSVPIAAPSAAQPLPKGASTPTPRQGSSTPSLNMHIPEDP